MKRNLGVFLLLTMLGSSGPTPPEPTPSAAPTVSTTVPDDFPIPLIPGATNIQYRVIKNSPILDFDVAKTVLEVQAYYEAELTKKGWEVKRIESGLDVSHNVSERLGVFSFQEETGKDLFVRILLTAPE